MMIMKGLKPRKQLGQHFLVDVNVARKIIRALDVHPEEVILEIGPGCGALTRFLRDQAKRLILVELDARLVASLRSDYQVETTRILHQDFLDFDLRRASREYKRKLRVVGNLPYNITSPILFKLIDACDVVQNAVVMIQLEVAERIVARPHTKDYGILSVFCQFYSKPTLLFKVSPNAFSPRPKVYSGLLDLDFSRRPSHALKDERLFRKVVRSTFGKRRKTLLNSLKYADLPRTNGAFWKKVDFDLSRRPEDLTVEEFVNLTNRIAESIGHG
ncbi:MAG: 16S rRNA (adenine(1518)-N(6)/adenine(1519)-N(6))-dimethyltransferase RsmA [Bacteroidota bacterium]